MNCGWTLPRAARLAAAMAAVLSVGEAQAATPMVKFLAGTYAMTDVNGGGSHALTITVPGILAVFSIDGGPEQFSMSDVSAPAGFFNGSTAKAPTSCPTTYSPSHGARPFGRMSLSIR